MFSFHILSTFIIWSLFFFSSGMIYAANPQTLRNAYQIESNGQTKSYHLNDYGKKMVKKMLGQYEKQIAQKWPDIIPLLITTTQDKLQRAQKTNSLWNMIIYTAVLYDLSQQNTSKWNDTTKETKITSTGSQPKKEVTNTVKSDQKEIDEYITLIKSLSKNADVILAGIDQEKINVNHLPKDQQELLLQKIGGCSKAYDLYISVWSLELKAKRSDEFSNRLESVLKEIFVNEKEQKIVWDKISLIFNISETLLWEKSLVCSYGKNKNFLDSSIGELFKNSHMHLNMSSIVLKDPKILNATTNEFIRNVFLDPQTRWLFPKNGIDKYTPRNSLIWGCLLAQNRLKSSDFLNWQKEAYSWINIDIVEANKIIKDEIEILCDNKLYYQEIQNAIDEVMKWKVKVDERRDTFILANRIYEINQKIFGESWWTAWIYFDTDKIKLFYAEKQEGEHTREFRKMLQEHEIAQLLLEIKFPPQSQLLNVDQTTVNPVNNSTTSTTAESSKISLAKEAIEFDRKNDINRIQGKETDEVLRWIDARRNIIWWREWKDALYGWKMDDIIIVVWDMRSYSNKDTVQSLELLWVPLSDLIWRNFNINWSPKIIDWWAGRDLLFVVWDVDISQADMKGIEDIKIY